MPDRAIIERMMRNLRPGWEPHPNPLPVNRTVFAAAKAAGYDMSRFVVSQPLPLWDRDLFTPPPDRLPDHLSGDLAPADYADAIGHRHGCPCESCKWNKALRDGD